MRCKVLLATCAALAAMSSVAQAATITTVANFPGTPIATRITFPTVNFTTPGVTSITTTTPATTAGTVASSTSALNSSPTSVFAQGGGTLSNLTISAPPGMAFTDLNFNVAVGVAPTAFDFVGTTVTGAVDVTAPLTTTLPTGTNNLVFTAEQGNLLTSLSISTATAGRFQSITFAGAPTNVGFTGLQEIPPPPEISLPASLPLFATGLAAVGLLGWRKKRKSTASVLAA